MNQRVLLRAVPAASHAGAFANGPAYENTLGPAHRHYIRVKARFLFRLLHRHLPSARRLIDLGCGTGQMEEALAGRGFEITGIDVAAPMVGYANSKGIPGARFLATDAASTGLPDGEFDAAFCTALFHHVPPPARAEVAQEAARLVRPGGLVVVFEHNPSNPVTRRMVRTSPVDQDAILLSRREMAVHLRGAGLNVETMRHLIFFPSVFGPLARVEPLISWLPAGGQYVIMARKPGNGGQTP